MIAWLLLRFCVWVVSHHCASGDFGRGVSQQAIQVAQEVWFHEIIAVYEAQELAVRQFNTHIART
jgi:hypothetical protein